MKNKKILVLEDDPILSFVLIEMLEALGHDHNITCQNVSDAKDLLGCDDFFAFAFLDVHVDNETSYDVARKLDKMDIPYCFASGSEESEQPEEFSNSDYLKKPYSSKDVKRVLAKYNLLQN